MNMTRHNNKIIDEGKIYKVDAFFSVMVSGREFRRPDNCSTIAKQRLILRIVCQFFAKPIVVP